MDGIGSAPQGSTERDSLTTSVDTFADPVLGGPTQKRKRGDAGVSQTQAESAVMASTAGKFESVNGSLTSMLNNLMSELSMLSGAWKGMAAGEFERVKAQYAKDLADLNRALLETSEAIRSSGVSYDASDSAAASRVSKSGGSYTLPL
jgi:WXG100 family type VII secretion target